MTESTKPTAFWISLVSLAATAIITGSVSYYYSQKSSREDAIRQQEASRQDAIRQHRALIYGQFIEAQRLLDQIPNDEETELQHAQRSAARTKMILYASPAVVELVAGAARAKESRNTGLWRESTIEYFQAMRREIFPLASSGVSRDAIFALLWPGSTEQARERRKAEESAKAAERNKREPGLER